MGGPEPPPQAQAQAVAPHQITLRMQVLTTEHWSLLASRGLAWNESFSRAGLAGQLALVQGHIRRGQAR